jgi:uncharacterized protein (TIGR02466 family)
MAEITPIFVTPVYKNKLSRPFTQEELDFVESINSYKQGLGNVNSDNKFVLSAPALQNLKKLIEENIQVYVKEVMKLDHEFYITNSWTNITELGQEHQLHNHSNSILSGVVYIKVSDSQPSITFNRLAPPFLLNMKPTEYNMFNSTEWSVSVEDGDILIFPSSCFHHVKVNQSNNRRISIAFNTFVRGTIGSESAGADLILM